MDVAAPHRVTTTVEWRQLRPWNFAGVMQAARWHRSSWPLPVIVAVTMVRPPLMTDTEPGVIVNFTRPLRRPIARFVNVGFFVSCFVATFLASITVGWWAAGVVLALLTIAALRLNVPALSAFEGPDDMLLLHDFIAEERGTRVPEAALGQLLARYDESIKLSVRSDRDGLVRMYQRLGFAPSSSVAKASKLVMIRPSST